tara:strand:+ start:1756 stop:2178 length:423 start_codon:yes stop_codon:yes gene_type:complete
MRLTQFSDFALRLLIHIASHPDRRTTIAEAAQVYGISRHHLMKVAHRLALAGLVKPSRGRNGGLNLARPAEAISLGDVLRATEPDFALVGCMAGHACPIVTTCRLPAALDAAMASFLATADQHMLAGFVGPPASAPLQSG